MNLTSTQVLYVVRRETFKSGKDEQTNIEAYNHDLKYIGKTPLARELCEKMGIVPETYGDEQVCTIGFAEHDETWYGWGGGAIAGFKKGHRVENNDVLLTLKKYKVGDKAKTLDDAKRMAIDFATIANRNNVQQQPHPSSTPKGGEEAGNPEEKN